MSKVNINIRKLQVEIDLNMTITDYSDLLNALDTIGKPSLTAMFEAKNKTDNPTQVPKLDDAVPVKPQVSLGHR